MGNDVTDYIRRDTALRAVTKRYGACRSPVQNRLLDEIRNEIRRAPAADVAELVHGKWDDSGRYTFPSGDTAVRCTNCGCALTESEYRLNNWNYCPVCGAMMNGGKT